MIVRKAQNDELYHHGIKGQRWGVRRYQNPDGTLTAEGRKRFGVGEPNKKAQKNYYKDTKRDRRINSFDSRGNSIRRTEELIRNNISVKEADKIKKLVAKENRLEADADAFEFGSKKYDNVIKQMESNNAEMKKIYSDIGQKIAGKYANKTLKRGYTYKYTVQDHISNTLYNMALDDLIKDEIDDEYGTPRKLPTKK